MPPDSFPHERSDFKALVEKRFELIQRRLYVINLDKFSWKKVSPASSMTSHAFEGGPCGIENVEICSNPSRTDHPGQTMFFVPL
jgi:hypothetical protein